MGCPDSFDSYQGIQTAIYSLSFKPWSSIYYALIRSILQYCSELWNYAIAQYLSDELEKVQKRAMRIIFPSYSYDEALQIS